MTRFLSPPTLAEQVGQMLFVGFDGLTAPPALLERIRAGQVGGVILFSRNVESPEQVAALTASLHAAAPYGLIVSIDQEGGTVARLRDGFTEVPSALALAAARDGEPHAEAVGRVLGAELRALGITWNYAPVVDLLYTYDNPSLLTRSFGGDPETVGTLAAAIVRGLQLAGAAACAKHFPGLGSTAIDTHVDLPVLNTPLTQIYTRDLIPYRGVIAAGIASVMATHTIYTALDPQHPATLSPIVIQRLLREELAFDGVVTTDCLEMGAITRHYGPEAAAVLAAQAGADAILFSHTPDVQDRAYAALLAAAESGDLPPDMIATANRRLAALKAQYSTPPVDAAGLAAIIASPEHRRIAQAAAQVGVVTSGTFALPADTSRAGLVEFGSVIGTGIEDRDGLAGLGRALAGTLPRSNIVTQTTGADLSAALALAARVEPLVLAVRNAHLNPAQLAQAQQIRDSAAGAVIVVALRSPQDVTVLHTSERVCGTLATLGDAAPQVQAAADLLTGVQFPPGAILPALAAGEPV